MVKGNFREHGGEGSQGRTFFSKRRRGSETTHINSRTGKGTGESSGIQKKLSSFIQVRRLGKVEWTPGALIPMAPRGLTESTPPRERVRKETGKITQEKPGIAQKAELTTDKLDSYPEAAPAISESIHTDSDSKIASSSGSQRPREDSDQGEQIRRGGLSNTADDSTGSHANLPQIRQHELPVPRREIEDHTVPVSRRDPPANLYSGVVEGLLAEINEPQVVFQPVMGSIRERKFAQRLIAGRANQTERTVRQALFDVVAGNIYRPKGRKGNQPIVEIRSTVLRRIGPPQITNYEKLDKLFRDELGVPDTAVPRIRLYGRRRNAMIGGYHRKSSSHTIHANAVTANGRPDGVMRTVIHEGKHLSDSINHQVLYNVSKVFKWTVPRAVAAGGLAISLAGMSPELVIPLIAASFIPLKMLTYQLNPIEIRARMAERKLIRGYKDAIKF